MNRLRDVDDALSPDFPLGDSLEVFIRCEDAERFVEEVRGDGPRSPRLRGQEGELAAGELNEQADLSAS